MKFQGPTPDQAWLSARCLWIKCKLSNTTLLPSHACLTPQSLPQRSVADSPSETVSKPLLVTVSQHSNRKVTKTGSQGQRLSFLFPGYFWNAKRRQGRDQWLPRKRWRKIKKCKRTLTSIELGRLRQEEHHETEASLGYTMSSSYR